MAVVQEGVGPLAGVRVLELTNGSHAVAYCGRLLSDMGASVAAVRSSEGMAPEPPYVTVKGRIVSASSLYEDTGKSEVLLCEDEETVRRQINVRMRSVDILIEALTSSGRQALVEEMGAGALPITHISITPRGVVGTQAAVRSTPFTLAYASGEAFANPSGVDYLERPPLPLPGHILEYDTSVVAAAIAVLGRLEAVESYRYCDLSIQDVAVTMIRPEMATAFTVGVEEDRTTRALEFGGTLRCADGWVTLIIREVTQWRGLVEMLGSPDWAIDPRYEDVDVRTADGFALTKKVEECFAARTKLELAEMAHQYGVPLAPVCDLGDVLGRTRAALHLDKECRDLRGTRILRPPSTRVVVTDEPSRTSPSSLGQRREPRPRSEDDALLAGVKVVDMSTVWAGPCAAMFLAMLGAEVVKVENPRRPDMTRRRLGTDGADTAFQLANLCKKSVVADWHTPAGRQYVADLCSGADLVISNISVRSLREVGLDHEHLAIGNPSLCWVHLSTLGATDQRALRGYAPIFAALSGVASVNGYPDGPPAEIRSGADMRVAYDAFLASCAALLHAEKSGRGAFVDISCSDSLSTRIGDLMIAFQWEGLNRRELAERSGKLIFGCADGKWVAVELESEQDWLVLARELGHGTACHKDIGSAVMVWAESLPADEVAERLAGAGLAVAAAWSNVQLSVQPHLWERRLFRSCPSNGGGTIDLVGVPWHSPANAWTSLTAGRADHLEPAPSLGMGPRPSWGSVPLTVVVRDA